MTEEEPNKKKQSLSDDRFQVWAKDHNNDWELKDTHFDRLDALSEADGCYRDHGVSSKVVDTETGKVEYLWNLSDKEKYESSSSSSLK